MYRFRHLAGVLLALSALCGSAGAQTITGLIVDDATGAPLPGALIVLVEGGLTEGLETVADDSGAFRIEAPGAGEYVLLASLIGYAEIRSEPVVVEIGENVIVEVRLAIEAVPLEPLVVRSRAMRGGAQLAGFYARLARGRRSGLGHFISREEVERMNPMETSDLLRMAPGVRVTPGRAGRGAAIRMSGGCTPAIYVDGMQVNRYPLGGTSVDDIVAGFTVEGVEVYRGAMAQVQGYHDPGGCGLVLVWTRRGEHMEGPWSWKKFLAGMGLFGILFFLIH